MSLCRLRSTECLTTTVAKRYTVVSAMQLYCSTEEEGLLTDQVVEGIRQSHKSLSSSHHTLPRAMFKSNSPTVILILYTFLRTRALHMGLDSSKKGVRTVKERIELDKCSSIYKRRLTSRRENMCQSISSSCSHSSSMFECGRLLASPVQWRHALLLRWLQSTLAPQSGFMGRPQPVLARP